MSEFVQTFQKLCDIAKTQLVIRIHTTESGKKHAFCHPIEVIVGTDTGALWHFAYRAEDPTTVDKDLQPSNLQAPLRLTDLSAPKGDRAINYWATTSKLWLSTKPIVISRHILGQNEGVDRLSIRAYSHAVTLGVLVSLVGQRDMYHQMNPPLFTGNPPPTEIVEQFRRRWNYFLADALEEQNRIARFLQY